MKNLVIILSRFSKTPLVSINYRKSLNLNSISSRGISHYVCLTIANKNEKVIISITNQIHLLPFFLVMWKLVESKLVVRWGEIVK